MLNSNTTPTCPHNMANFGPIAAEIVSLDLGNPANFNGFRVLAASLHGALVLGVSQTATLNRGRHLYSAGWPSRWALAHILVNQTCPSLGLRGPNASSYRISLQSVEQLLTYVDLTLFTARRRASAVYTVVIYLSVTSRCSTKTAKRKQRHAIA